MRHERIRACPSWQNGPHRNDCLFATKDIELPGMQGLHAARVILFFSIKHEGCFYPCALVQWFVLKGCDETGMWIVEREWADDGTQVSSVIHLDCVVRGAHLVPVYGTEFLPRYINYSNSLDLFLAYYVSKYVDHHANEIAF
jgi:hypothetical protein